MRILRDSPVATNLARTATLKSDPPTIGVEVHVKDRAVALNAGLRVNGKNLLGHQYVPPEMPPLKVPVPTTARPVADSVERNTPRIEVLNSPEAARYTPVLASDEKYKAGAPTVPLTKPIDEAPASTVLALTKLLESQISVACWFDAIVAVDPPVLVERVTV
jgi:hypothetical protein